MAIPSYGPCALDFGQDNQKRGSDAMARPRSTLFSAAGLSPTSLILSIALATGFALRAEAQAPPSVTAKPGEWRYLGNDPVGFGLAHRMLAATNMLHMLPKITVPTMVVAGKHDTVRPSAGTAELAKKILGARFELVEEAGHFLPTTGPKTLLRLLKDFLPK